MAETRLWVSGESKAFGRLQLPQARVLQPFASDTDTSPADRVLPAVVFPPHPLAAPAVHAFFFAFISAFCPRPPPVCVVSGIQHRIHANWTLLYTCLTI